MGYVKLPSHKKGDWWNGMRVTVTPAVGTDPIDMTTITAILMQFKLDPASKKSYLEFSLENGKITVLNAAQFSIAGCVVDIPAGTYYSDIEITTADGKPLTIASYTMEVAQDVSRKEVV